MIDVPLELTWKVTKRQVCDIRSANLQCDAVSGEAELRLMPKELFLVQYQEIVSGLVGV